MAIRQDGRLECVPFAIVLGVQYDPAGQLPDRVNLDLYLDIWGHGDVEDLAVSGKPGVGPTAVVADADRGDGVDNSKWNGVAHSFHHAGSEAGASDRQMVCSSQLGQLSTSCMLRNNGRGRSTDMAI